MKKNTFSEKMDKLVAGKGFYIALFVCIAIIGVTSWAILVSEKDNTTDIDAMYSVSGSDKTDSGAKSSQQSSGKSSSRTDKTDTKKPTVSMPDDTIGKTGTQPVISKENAPEQEAEPVINDEPQPKKPVFVWPVVGEIITEHSLETLVYDMTMADWRTHNGIDIAAERGTTVLAVSDGTVDQIYNDDLFGTTVVIAHDSGLKSIYSNLASLPTVKIGDSVTTGEIIGSVGNTAIGEINESPHLHLSMTLNGEKVDPRNYLPHQ